jgi:hypothetical protein
MSEVGQGQQQEKHHSIESSLENSLSVVSNPDSTSGFPNRRPRAGVLLLEVYEQGQQGHKGTSVAPRKILLEWTKKLVSFLIPCFVFHRTPCPEVVDRLFTERL